MGRRGIAGFIGLASPLGYLTSRFWSPSVLWAIDLVIVLTGLGFVVAAVNAAIRIMFTMGRERALPGSLGRLSHRRTPVVAIGCLAVITLLIGLPLTYVYGGVPTFGYLAGIGGLPVVLIYLTVNIAVIRAFRTEFRDEFRLGRHLLILAAASAVFLFPSGASCSRVPTRWRTCCPSYPSAGWSSGRLPPESYGRDGPPPSRPRRRAVAPIPDKQREPD